MAALFGNTAGARNQSKNLVEFKAGKMYMEKKMVHPDKRKGLVYLYQSDDSLMHFCWKDRTKGTVEDDFIIFPEDVEFKHVPQCTTGRVYLLKFKSNNRKMFFWMQEPKADKDKELMKKVNDSLNNPPTPGSSSRAGGSSSNLPADIAGESDLQSLLGNMSQQQLMQLLGGMGMGGLGGLSSALMGAGRPGSSSSEPLTLPPRVQSSPGPRSSSTSTSNTPSTTQPRPVTAAAVSSTPAPAPANPTPATAAAGGRPTIQLSDLQNILSGLGPDGAPTPGAGASGGAASAGSGEAIDLSSAVTAEAMLPILANADVQSKLLPHLPEGETLPRTVSELRNTVSTPQFQQALQSFSAALASGQLGPLMQQFDLGDDVSAAAAAGDVEGFVKAMQAREKKEEEKE